MIVVAQAELRDPGERLQKPLVEGGGSARVPILEGLCVSGQVVESQTRYGHKGRNKTRTRFQN